MRCHSVRSWLSPLCLSFHAELVARVALATATPLGVYRISGSAPKFPIKMTLLIPLAMLVSSYPHIFKHKSFTAQTAWSQDYSPPTVFAIRVDQLISCPL